MLTKIQAILLAGGKSQRFHTGRTKLIEKICGKAMILYPIELLQKLKIPTSVVVGFQQGSVLKKLQNKLYENISFIKQTAQLGSGDALKASQSLWNQDHILVLNADIPLLGAETLQKLYNKHVNTDADISFVTSHASGYDNYGQCVVVIDNKKIHVRENFGAAEDSQCCISAGIYLMKRSFLEKHIDSLTKSTITGEYYLPELVNVASENQGKIVTTDAPFDQIRGVNTLAELWVVEHIKRSQIISEWMRRGVRFASTNNVMIDETVILEPGTYIGSSTHLLGTTHVKKNSIIGAYTYIKNSIIEESCKIKTHNVICNSIIAKNTVVEPFSNIQNQQKVVVKNPQITFTGATMITDFDHTQNRL
jgi:bifunctional UDP-N-acetylglucosamine pyrophosphorylase/glucosamine-1-phosphate N-acetyltransferase